MDGSKKRRSSDTGQRAKLVELSDGSRKVLWIVGCAEPESDEVFHGLDQVHLGRFLQGHRGDVSHGSASVSMSTTF